MYQMPTGAAADAAANFSRGLLSLTKDNSPIIFPGGKNWGQVAARPLPAFDFGSYSTETDPTVDPAFLTSWTGFRNPEGGCEPESGLPYFSPWIVAIRYYRYFGRSSSDFLSPLSIPKELQTGPHGDPIQDCRNYVRQANNPAWMAMVENNPNSKERPPLPMEDIGYVANYALNSGTGSIEVAPMVISPTAYEYFKKQVAWPHVGTGAPHDPDWPNQLLGDVTHPERGLAGMVMKKQLGTVTPWCVVFTRRENYPDGMQVVPIGEAELRQRKMITDPVNFWNIPTYQEGVNLLIEDGLIPVEIIKAACSHKADTSAAKEATGNPQDHQGWNAQQGGSPAPDPANSGWGAGNQQPAQTPAQQPGGWGQQPAQQSGGWGQQPAQQPGGWGDQQPAQQQPTGWGQPATQAPAQQEAQHPQPGENAWDPQDANPGTQPGGSEAQYWVSTQQNPTPVKMVESAVRAQLGTVPMRVMKDGDPTNNWQDPTTLPEFAVGKPQQEAPAGPSAPAWGDASQSTSTPQQSATPTQPAPSFDQRLAQQPPAQSAAQAQPTTTAPSQGPGSAQQPAGPSFGNEQAAQPLNPQELQTLEGLHDRVQKHDPELSGLELSTYSQLKTRAIQNGQMPQ